jgi:hypothetical protein
MRVRQYIDPFALGSCVGPIPELRASPYMYQSLLTIYESFPQKKTIYESMCTCVCRSTRSLLSLQL